MNKLALAVAVTLSALAFAKAPPAQTHQCMKDGQVLEKTRKECAKAGGKWEKKPATPKPADTKPADTTSADAGTP